MNVLDLSSVVRSRPNDSGFIFRPKRATHANQMLTLADAEGGVLLRVGEQFSLDWGDEGWNVRVRDQAVLATVDGESFQAVQTGKTKVYVTRQLSSDSLGPPGAPRKLFVEIPVTVICP